MIPRITATPTAIFATWEVTCEKSEVRSNNSRYIFTNEFRSFRIPPALARTIRKALAE